MSLSSQSFFLLPCRMEPGSPCSSLSSHSFYFLLEWSQEASAHYSPYIFWAMEELLQSSLPTQA